MPIYEYRCTACGKRFEISQSMKDSSIGTCPERTGTMRRVFYSCISRRRILITSDKYCGDGGTRNALEASFRRR